MPSKLRQLARANYTQYTKQGDSFCRFVVLQGLELVHAVHAGSWDGSTDKTSSGSPFRFPVWAGRQNHPRLAVPLSCARISPRSSNHHTKRPSNCCLCVRSMRLQASRHSCSLPTFGLCNRRAAQYFEVSVAEVMTKSTSSCYTVSARPIEVVGFP
jgi:hypothetical protein